MRAKPYHSMSPWRLETRLSELFSAEVEKLRRTKNSCLEEAVALWLASRGVEGVDVPAGCGALGVVKPVVDAEEKARIEAEKKVAEAQKAKENLFKIRKAWNDNFRARGEVPKNGFAAENEEEEEAERRAEEEARKREQAEKEGAFV